MSSRPSASYQWWRYGKVGKANEVTTICQVTGLCEQTNNVCFVTRYHYKCWEGGERGGSRVAAERLGLPAL